MKIKLSLPLFALGIALTAPTSWAQTTPTGTATSSTIPQGAIATDSTTGKMTRQQKRAMKRTKRMTNQNSNTNSGTTNTSTQDARYRQSSASNGTAVNNSNSTNYNSNNATNAPTGAGSNPNTATTSPTPTSQGSNTQTTSTPDSNAGTAAAVSGAKSTAEPAVKSGSTVRNTSIGDFVASSPNYTTLQNALQSADLWETLKGGGPFTVFAPDNSAFKKLTTSAQGALLEGNNRAALKQLLSYHVVSGSVSADALAQQIKAGNGKAKLTTLSGAVLTASESNGRITLTDEQGGTATVDSPDNRQMNGVVHGVTGVLMPKTGMEAFR